MIFSSNASVIVMDNFTDLCNATLLNFTMDLEDSGLPCDSSTEAVAHSVVQDDALYWEKVLPKFRQLYIEEMYGEYYRLLFYVSFAVCVMGYITNTFNVVVLSSTPMAHSMNLFLLVLSAADVFHITTQFSHVLHFMSGFKLFPGYHWVVFFQWNTYFETLFLFLTNWLAVSIGAWRFIAITWPLHTRDWCSKGRARLVISIILVLSAVLATPVFAFISYRKYTHRGMDVYDKTFSDFAKDHDGAFLRCYWVLLLFMGFVPSLLLAVLTFGLFRNLYKARTKRRNFVDPRKATTVVGSHKTTIMLTILLILYILSNFPDGCMYMVSIITNGDEKLQAQTRHFTDIVRIFMLTNNSTAFFIYYGLGEGFRKRFHRIFCCCIVDKLSRDRDESGKTTISEITGSRTSSQLHHPSVLENSEMLVTFVNVGTSNV